MEYVRLGGSDLRVSRIGFGGDPMGGHGWGKTSEDELVRAVREALDVGVNLFDTADCYGLGESERLLGEALGSRRGEAVIATKFGVRAGPGRPTVYDNSLAWMEAALDASLRRLGTDVIDLYQVHYWDTTTPMGAVFSALERERARGRIRWYGVTNIDPADHLDVTEAPGLVSFSYEYSLAKRVYEPVIERLAADLGFLSWGSLGQGVLSGKYGPDTVFAADDRRSREVYVNFRGETFMRNLAIVERMRALCAGYPGQSPSRMAIRWILDRLPGASVLVGIKTVAQLHDNVAATGWSLTREDVAVLDRMSRP